MCCIQQYSSTCYRITDLCTGIPYARKAHLVRKTIEFVLACFAKLPGHPVVFFVCRFAPCSNFHQRNVVPRSNLSPAILNGEGPGVAAALAMEWGTEMSGIHHQYQTWGYIDPFGELLNSTS